ALILPSVEAGLTGPKAEAGLQPGTPQAEAAALSALSENLQPRLEAAASQANADPRSDGETIERLLEGRPAGEGASVIAEINRTGSDVLSAAELPNPYGLYLHALPIARAAAQSLGKKPAQVHLY